jgi:hypothetical protein
MNFNNDSPNPNKPLPPAWIRWMKAAAVVEMSLLGLAWMAFGIVAFFVIDHWGVEYDRKIAAIHDGRVKPEMLKISNIAKGDNSGRWNISLHKDGKDVIWRSDSRVDDLKVGGEMAAYRFGSEYLIPRFDHGGYWGKWIFLGFGMLPLPVAAVALLVGKLRKGPKNASMTTDWQPNISGTLESSSRPVLPKAFSLDSMSYDHDPTDAELSCLLNGPSQPMGFKVVEADGMFHVNTSQIPVKGIMLTMVLGAIVLILFGYFCIFHTSGSSSFPNNIIFSIWVAGNCFIVALFSILLPLINSQLAKKEDFIRVDMSKRTLELCRKKRAFRASEIHAFTELSRYFRHSVSGSEWRLQTQIGVLVRVDHGGMELFPLVKGKSKSPLSDQLAGIFQKPVRRIELSKNESKALNDC